MEGAWTWSTVAHLAVELRALPVGHLALRVQTLCLMVRALREACSEGQEVFDRPIAFIVFDLLHNTALVTSRYSLGHVTVPSGSRHSTLWVWVWSLLLSEPIAEVGGGRWEDETESKKQE